MEKTRSVFVDVTVVGCAASLREIEVSVTAESGKSSTYTLQIRRSTTPEKNTLAAHYDTTVLDSVYLCDASGNHNDMALGGVEVDSAEKSLIFNGKDTPLQLKDGNGINFGTEPFSISMWIKPQSVNDIQILYWYGDVGSDKSQCWIRLNKGDLQFNLAQAGKGQQILTAPNAVTEGEWTHICAVRDVNSMTLYVNGKSAVTAEIPELDITAANYFYLGYDRNSSRHFVGRAFLLQIHAR